MATLEQTHLCIHDHQHPVVQLIQAVLQGKRKGRRFILIDDQENILQALKAGIHLHTLFHTKSLDPLFKTQLPNSLTIQSMTSQVGQHIFGVERLSRVFALAYKPLSQTLDDLQMLKGDVVVLDGVSLMGNIGAVIRSASAFGATGVIIVNTPLQSAFDRRLIRASRGLVFKLPVVMTSTSKLLDFCRDGQISLLTTSADATTPVNELAFVSNRLALVFGAEKYGCSQELCQKASYHVGISIQNTVESLNLSVAASIVLYCRRHWNMAI